MSRERESSGLYHPSRFFAVAITAAGLVVVFGLGFLLLPRYAGPRGTLSARDAAYHALGFHLHNKTLNGIEPPLKVPTRISWTEATIRQAMGGDPKRGESIASGCTPCHVDLATISDRSIPILGGLDRLVMYKQLDDYQSGTRKSDAMSAIVQSLTPQQFADVAAYFAPQAGLPENNGERTPRPNRSYRNGDPVQRLIFAGDPKRGIAACASCHGPGGYLIGAPALANQNAPYIEQQLQAFAQGTRANDMNMPMRTMAGMLTPDEMKSLATAYSDGLSGLK